MKREAIEHARFRALAQITLNKDKGVEAFEQYMTVAFPYLEATKKRERRNFIEVLKKEISRGPLRVRAAPTPQLSSRIASRRNRAALLSPREEESVYRKMGRSI